MKPALLLLLIRENEKYKKTILSFLHFHAVEAAVP